MTEINKAMKAGEPGLEHVAVFSRVSQTCSLRVVPDTCLSLTTAPAGGSDRIIDNKWLNDAHENVVKSALAPGQDFYLSLAGSRRLYAVAFAVATPSPPNQLTDRSLIRATD